MLIAGFIFSETYSEIITEYRKIFNIQTVTKSKNFMNSLRKKYILPDRFAAKK